MAPLYLPRGHRLEFLNQDTLQSLKIVIILANSVDSYEMLQYATFHLGLHCLQKTHLRDTSKFIYYIPITDTTLELSVFWPSDTEMQINELRFSKSISFKTRLMSVTCFCGDVT